MVGYCIALLLMVCDCVAQLQDALLEQMEEKDAQARRTSHVALDSASTADPTAHAPLSHRTGRPIMPIAHWRFSRTYSRID